MNLPIGLLIVLGLLIQASKALDVESGQFLRRNHAEASPAQKPKKSDRIAIIGGGVHGVLTARALKKGGYDNIVVYEKAETLGGPAETFQADGHIFDYSIKYIPADSLHGPGVPTDMSNLISEYGLSVRPYAVPIINYQHATENIFPLPKVLLPYAATPEGQQVLVGNLITGFELLKEAVTAGKTPEALINAGIVLKAETWAQFSERIQLPAFTDLCEFLHDVFLGGPASAHPAATVLNVRAVYMPSYIKAFLSGMGITSNTTLPISNELRSVLANPFPGTSFVINEGYQRLFEAIVEHERIEVCLGCEVTKVKKTKGSVKVYTGKTGKHSFDHVIISSRPHDSKDFLKGRSSLKDLVLQASDKQIVTTVAFRAESTPAALSDSFASIMYPESSTFPRDGTLTAVAKDYDDSNVLVAVGYADIKASKDEGIAKAVTDLEEYEMPVTEMISYRTYIYPSVPRPEAVAEDWFAKMSDLQGFNNIYCVGEALSGLGVPAALNFVTDFFDKYFSDGN